MSSAMSHAPNRSLVRLLAGVLAGAGALVALAAPAPVSAATASKSPSGAQTIPLPASAKVQPGAAGGAAAPTSTYVPPAGAAPATGAATTGTTPAATQRSGTPNSSQARAHGASKLSTAAIVLAALAALLALGCAAWGIARLRAYEPHWARSARHAVAEAGFRVSATWAEFSDWIRLGH
jgi:hypothetical protein